LTPTSAALLVQKGLKVRVEENAGALASFQNHEYEKAGAEVVATKKAFDNDILFKIRPPKQNEVEFIRQNGTLISFIQPVQNADLIKQLQKRQITALGMELIPRVSRAQVFDALSSMANIAGSFRYSYSRDLFVFRLQSSS
jgi:NAD/NADP transhydrogenase alpha subunit